MNFDKITDTISKRKENKKKSIAEALIDEAEVVDIKSVSIDTLLDYTDKDGEQPFSIDEEKVAALAESIRDNGQLEPIIVRKHPTRHKYYQILAGHHRKRAIIAADVETAKIQIIDADNWTAYSIVCETNIHHDKPLPSQLCKIFKRYKAHAHENEEKLTVAQLAQMYGVSKEQLYRYIAIDELIAELKKLIDEGLISSNSIKELRNLTPLKQKKAADYIEYTGKKLSPGKCKKLVQLLKESADDITSEEIEAALEKSGKGTEVYTNYNRIKSMSADELSVFILSEILSRKFSSTEEIRSFLETSVNTDEDITKE